MPERSPASPATRAAGVYRDEYCRGRLLFPLTNHPPMSRGGCAAMFYSPPVDSLDIRTPSLRLSSSLTEFLLLLLLLLEITLTDSSKTYRLQKYSPSPLLICDRPNEFAQISRENRRFQSFYDFTTNFFFLFAIF